ncbi:hypothetical protein ACFL1F_01105 [Chlamydiota bacterium]
MAWFLLSLVVKDNQFKIGGKFMKNIISFIFISLLSTGLLFSMSNKDKMIDSFGQGFAAAKDKNKKEAVKQFTNAGKYAIKAEEWQGCLDAANALSTMGSPADGVKFIDSAFDIAKKQNDWRIAIACGYAYAGLPSDLKKISDAEKAFNDAGKLASSKKNWIGLTEASNGLINIKKNNDAVSLLDDAFEIVKKEKSLQGCKTLTKILDRIGDTDRKNLVLSYKDSILGDKFERPVVTPPDGWSPVGESVASPKIPDKEQQQASWDAANKEIESKREWETQQEQLKLEREKLQAERDENAAMYAYANSYRNYYYYPYGHSTYNSWGWNDITGWADHYYGGYSYRNGYYVYNRGYSGFGFNYGYNNRRSGVSFGFGIYDWD